MACSYRHTFFHRSLAEPDCFANRVVETLDRGPLTWIDGLRFRFSFRQWEQDGDSFRFISVLGQHTVRTHSLLAGSATGKHRLIGISPQKHHFAAGVANIDFATGLRTM